MSIDVIRFSGYDPIEGHILKWKWTPIWQGHINRMWPYAYYAYETINITVRLLDSYEAFLERCGNG